MKLIILTALVVFHSTMAFALTGQLLPVEELIPQVCKVQFVSGEYCGGTIIGERAVALAYHCGVYVKRTGSEQPIGRVYCLGEGKKVHKFKEVHVMDRAYIEKTLGKPVDESVLPQINLAAPLESSRYDVAVVVTEDKMETPPLPLAAPEMNEAVLNALVTWGKCRIYSVGLNQLGSFGVAHGVTAPAYRAISGPYNPIELVGAAGATDHDSGGGLVCEVGRQNVLAGVVSKGNGLVSSTLAESTQNQHARTAFSYVGDPVVNQWLSEAAKR